MSKTRLWVYGKDGQEADHLGVITVDSWAGGQGRLILSIQPKKVKPKQLDNGILDGRGMVVLCYRNDKGDKFQDQYSGVKLIDAHGTYTTKNGVLEESVLTSVAFTYKSVVKKVRRADCPLPDEGDKISTSNMKDFEFVEL